MAASATWLLKDNGILLTIFFYLRVKYILYFFVIVADCSFTLFLGRQIQISKTSD
jgi:hypothetical protein